MRTRLFSQTIDEHVSGSAQPQLPIRDIRKMIIPNPPKEKINTFINEASSLYKKIFNNESQIRTLEKLRYTLLPKLMSGEVRVAV